MKRRMVSILLVMALVLTSGDFSVFAVEEANVVESVVGEEAEKETCSAAEEEFAEEGKVEQGITRESETEYGEITDSSELTNVTETAGNNESCSIIEKEDNKLENDNVEKITSTEIDKENNESAETSVEQSDLQETSLVSDVEVNETESYSEEATEREIETEEENVDLLSGVMASGKCGDNVIWELTEDGTLTISGTGAMYSYSASLTEYKKYFKKLVISNGVTELGDSTFKDCNGFTGILEIPNSVVKIGNYTFQNCSGFTGKLEIPNSVTEIGRWAFRDCSGFTGNLEIPSSVTEIGDSAFEGCSGFTGELKIPNGITVIRKELFNGCSGFTGNLNIPNSVIEIEASAFSGCSGFTGSLKIPDSVTKIGASVFSGCSGFIGSLEIPNGITAINNSTFKGCSGFTGSLKIPDSVTWIGDETFSGCSGFTGSLKIPNGVTVIGVNAFSGCNGFIGSLEIPSSVTEVKYGTFSGCSGFTGSLKIPNGVTVIGANAFGGCNGFIGSLEIPNSVTRIDYWAFQDCSGFVGKLEIPNNVIEISGSAFKNCSGFTELNIGDSVTEIGEEAFSGCNGFTGNLEIPNSVIEIEKKAFSGCSGFTGDLIIGNSVTKIGNGAFTGCSGFTGSLEIPNSVTTIGSSAFYDCSGFIGDLMIGNCVTEIGDWAFDGCSGFTGNLKIPDSVTKIGAKAFCVCSGFTGNLEIPNSVIEIGYSAFSGCSGFTGSLEIPNSVTTIGSSAFSGCSGFTGDLVIPDSITVIPYGAFYDCTGFDGSLIIPEGITDIESRAFYNCSGFRGNLIIPKSATNTGAFAFYNCSGFTGDLIIPEGETGIGVSAFEGCSGLDGKLVIPDSVSFIYENAFYNCSALTGELNIPSGVTEISKGAFYNCKGFTGELIIPTSITKIESEAFYQCNGFTGDLIIPDNVISIGKGAFYQCSGLNGRLTLGSCLETIGNEAFYKCSGLTGDLVIPNNVTSIGSIDYNRYGVFEDCSGFSGDLVIGNSVTSIGCSAFRNCNGFAGCLIISESVTDIGSGAFEGCSKLSGKLTIPKGLTVISDRVFLNCYCLTGDLIIPNSVKSIGDRAFYNCIGLDGNLIIGNNVEIIRNGAFYNCCNLTGNLNIPDSVIKIGREKGSIGSYDSSTFQGVFKNCKSLDGNLILSENIKELYEETFSGCSNLAGSLIIPNNVTYIGNKVFENCKGFKGSLTIGNGVNIIGESAFCGCSGLAGNLIIPNSVTSIGRSAFSGCSGFIGDLAIPNSITEIKDYTFSDCIGLTGNLTISNNVTSIGERAFYGCSNLTGSLIIPSKVITIGSYAFKDCSGFTGTLTIPNSVTEIGKYAFSGCSGFTGNLTIGDGITTIEEYTFCDCSGFRGKLILGSGVTNIRGYAFSGCRGLAGNLEIPNQITSIGTGAFSNCASLITVVLSENMKSLPDYTFDGCSSLQELVIPKGVTSLGYYMIRGTAIDSIKIPSTVTESRTQASYNCNGALAGCDLLNEVIFEEGTTVIPKYLCASASQKSYIKNVVIPESVKNVENYAFYNCNNLTSIYYGGSEQQWKDITVGTNNTPLTNVIKSDGIHYLTTEAEYVSLTRVTLSSSGNSGPYLDDNDFLALNIGINWDSDDDGKTVTWQSSNPEVFELTRETSAKYHHGEINGEYYSGVLYGEIYAEKLTWWHVYGNARSLGKSIITVTTSDGVSESFELTVTERPNDVSLSGANRMEVGGYYPIAVQITINKKYLADGEKPQVEWKSSDGRVLAFDENGSESVVHTINNSDNKDAVIVYASSLGQASISCSLLGSGETSKFKITVYGESVPELQEKINDWQTAYISYIEAVQKTMEKQKNISSATIEKQAQALKEVDESSKSELVKFIDRNTDEKVKKYVYQATVRFLEDCAAGNLDLGSLNASTDVTSMASNIVQKIYKSVDIQPYRYTFDGDIVITIQGFTLSSAHQRTVTYSKKGKSETVAYIVSTKSQMQSIIESYLNELIKLEKAEINKAYSEMLKCVFGKDLNGLVKSKIQKALSNKYTDAFEKSGVGKIVNALNTGIDYYNYTKNIVQNARKDPQRLYQNLTSMKELRFESTSIKDKLVKAAMKRVEKAKESLEEALDEYVKTGTISKKSLFGIIASFKCPVSIEVYDSKGTQVGYVGDDDLWYNDNVISIERFGDTKTIYSYGEELTFKAVGTDDGILNCTFEEYTDGAALKRINYYDISLYDGKEILAEIPGQDLTEDSIKLIANGTENISISESIDATDYDKETVNISYSVNLSEGGQVLGTGEYVHGDTVTLLAETNSGYIFLGWQSDEETFVSFSPIYEFVAKDDLMLTALFAQNNLSVDEGDIVDYVVTFDSDGGTEITTQIIQEYERAIEPPIPIKEGYNFTGWYMDGMLFDFNVGITSDITLIAGWTEMEKLTVPNASIVSGSEVESGTKLNLSSPEKAYIYYTIDGTEPTRKSKFYVSPIVITENMIIKAIAVKDGYIDSDIVVFTYTASTSFTVTFNSNGGTKVETQIVSKGNKATVPSVPIKDGYVFSGWYLNGVLYDFDMPVASNIILEAVWTESGKIVTPISNISSGSVVKKGTQITLTSEEKAIIYYTVDGTIPTTDSLLYSKPIVVNADMTIQAIAVKEGYENSDIATFVYTIAQGQYYTVTFNSNGGTYIRTQTVQEYGKASEPTIPTRVGYIFTGWYLNGVLYDFDTEVTSDITLEARWTEIGKVAMPTPNIVSGSIVKSGTKLRLISDEGAKIYYTLDGTIPTVSSNLFTEDILITQHTIIKAFAVKEGFKDSDVATFIYDISTSDNPDDMGDVLPEDIPSNGIPNGLWIAGVNDVTYTGKAIKPSVRVYDCKTRLTEKRDYTVSYKNNVNANNAADESKAPSVIIKAKGNYSGKETATFKILPIDINSIGFVIEDIAVNPNQKVQKPIPAVTYNGKKLSNKKDFTVTYPDTSANAYKEKGKYAIKITGQGNYAGEKTINLLITDNILITKAKVSKISTQQYTGKALTPTVQVKYGKTVLKQGTDYELTYQNNVKIGVAYAVIEGKGGYSGQKAVPFQITGMAINKATVTGLDTPIAFNGTALTKNIALAVTVDGSQKTLKAGQDYTVIYQNNKNAGTATVIFTGINGYSGTLKKTFKINPYDLQTDTDKKISYNKKPSVPYAKDGSCPEPVIYFNNTKLEKDRDYSLSYKNNKAVNSGISPDTAPVAVVKGKGNFKGTLSIPFAITSQDISNLTLTASDKEYKNRANIFATNITVTDTNGKALSAGKDYDKSSIVYTYANAVKLENGVSKKAGDVVEKTDFIPSDTKIQVSVTAKAGGYYTGTAKGIYRIIKSDIKKAKVSISVQTYTGESIVPKKSDITATVGGTKLAESEFEIVSCTNNIKKGNATITIKGKGNYGGTKTIRFKIQSKGFLWWWRK